MGYTVKSKQDVVVQLVLQTSEKMFTPSQIADHSTPSQISVPVNVEVYFQIED